MKGVLLLVACGGLCFAVLLAAPGVRASQAFPPALHPEAIRASAASGAESAAMDAASIEPTPIESRSPSDRQPTGATADAEGTNRHFDSSAAEIGAWAGRVVNSSGAGVPFSRLTPFNPARGKAVEGDLSGAFVLPASGAGGEAHLLVEHQDYAPSLVSLNSLVADAHARQLTPIRLSAGGSLRVMPLLQGGGNGELAHVVAEPALGSDFRRAGQCREADVPLGQTATLAHLAPGTYHLSIAGPGLSPTTVQDVRVVEGACSDIGVVELRATRPLTGRVVDQADTPVAAATVRVFAPSRSPDIGARASSVLLATGTSGPGGAFSLDLPGEGPVRIEVHAAGYRSTALAWTDPACEGAIVRLERGVAVHVQVVETTGADITGRVERARLVRKDRETPELVASRLSGAWLFEGCDPGEHHLLLDFKGGTVQEHTLTVSGAGDTERHTLTVAAQRSIDGRVTDGGSGAGLAGAVISLCRLDGSGGQAVSTRADADGRFSLPCEQGRAMRLLVSADGFRRAARELAGGDVDAGTIELDGNALVRGHCAVPAGTTGTVQVVAFSSLDTLRTVSVGADGTFEIPDVAPGHVYLRAFEGDLRAFLSAQIPWVFRDTAQWPAPGLVCAPGEEREFDLVLQIEPRGSLVRGYTFGNLSGLDQVAAILVRESDAVHGGVTYRNRLTGTLDSFGDVEFRYDGVPVGRYRLVLTTTGAGKRVLADERFEITAGVSRPAALTVHTARLAIELLETTAANGTWILVVEQAGLAPTRRVLSDEPLIVAGLSPGMASVRVLEGARVLATRNVDLVAGAEKQVQLSLE